MALHEHFFNYSFKTWQNDKIAFTMNVERRFQASKRLQNTKQVQ